MFRNINIDLPSKDIGFVEYKRSFVVQGTFNIDVPDSASLIINIYDSKNNIVRFIHADKKNGDFLLDYQGFISYADELDLKRVKLRDYGFPELCVKDINNVESSIHNGTIKCWFNNHVFKGIITNCSDIEHGAIADDGLNFLDENGEPYSSLELGKYKIEVILLNEGNIIDKAYKDFVIGKRDKQLICRFNPDSHKKRMIKWCKDNDIAIIEDLLPGYLNPYLGIWYYHMGLLQMYRANDLCLFYDCKVIMFVYLIDPTSTSYETELAYLQAQNKINSNYFEAWHYDIGEARINELIGRPIRFNDDEYLSICRIDVVNEKANENVYNLDNKHIEMVINDLNNIELNYTDTIQIMGVLKPWQMDTEDFIRKADNTYEIHNCPYIVRYKFMFDNKIIVEDRKLLLERIDNESIGTSVYEFYNLFKIKEDWKDKNILINISCIDKKGNICPGDFNLKIKIK